MKVCGHPIRRNGEEHPCVLPDGHGMPLHQAGPIRQVSDKRRSAERDYTRLRNAFLTPYRQCMFPGGDCPYIATEVHHMRGRVGGDYLDTEHWAALCHDHHAWVTEHPAESYDLGISERRIA